MDIVVANSRDISLSILLGSFNQVFKHQKTMITENGSLPRSFTTGDFNNNAHSDIAVVNTGTSILGIFLGHDNGSFAPQTQYPTVSSPSLTAVGDHNTDTHLDVVVVSLYESTFAIHLGRGNGSFTDYTKQSTDVHSRPKSVSVADFNDDTILDIIIIGNYDPSNVVVFLGHGNGSFAPPKKV